MNFSKQTLSIEEARQSDLVDYLSKLGYKPAKVSGCNYWYLSPLREEKTASFKVNRKLNRWYDHGIGKGGNIIDFAILYHNYSVGEFLKEISDNFSFQQHPNLSSSPEEIRGKICIVKDSSIRSFTLFRYLQERRIPYDIAVTYCREVSYELNGKNYYAIGFKNDSGGYEIRNPHFKASSSPKDITTFNNGAPEAIVFEGFTDFLSFMAIHKNQSQIPSDFVILNSVSFFERARSFMERHECIRLYLDRDTTGQNCSKYALSLSTKYNDESCLYQHYKDLNDWWVNFGKGQKKSLRQKL